MDRNWDDFLKIVFDQGVANLVYPELKNRRIPFQVRSRLEKSYEATLVLNLITIRFITELEPLCRRDGTAVLTLKGVSLLDDVYFQTGLRPMTDIDLMVRPENLSRFTTLLEQLGFQRSAGRLFKKNHTLIDLHTHALNTDRIAGREYLFPLGMDPIWEAAQPWRPGFVAVKKPHPVDNVLLLCQHCLKHSFSRLLWLVDIHRLLRRFSEKDWLFLRARTLKLAQEKSLAYCLFLLRLYFNFHPPLQSAWPNDWLRINRMEKAVLVNNPFDAGRARPGPLLSIFCIRGLGKRIRFALENLFPGKKIVRAEFAESHGGKRARLYPLRLARSLRQVASLAAAFFFTKRKK